MRVQNLFTYVCMYVCSRTFPSPKLHQKPTALWAFVFSRICFLLHRISSCCCFHKYLVKMTLKTCRACNNLVSYRAITCPNCGEPDPVGRQRKSDRSRFIFGVGIAIAAIYYLWFSYAPDAREHGLFHAITQHR